MAFVDRFGDIFVGHALHCYRASDVYAFQVVGSTAKSPICRAVPVRRETTRDDAFGGSATFTLDTEWLDANPLPSAPLRRSTPDAHALRTRIEPLDYVDNVPSDERHVVALVPNSRADYSGGAVTLPLMSENDARRYTHTCTWCQY